MTTFGAPDEQPGTTLSGKAMFNEHGDFTGLKSDSGDIFDVYDQHLARTQRDAKDLDVVSGDPISLQVVENVGGERYVRITKT